MNYWYRVTLSKDRTKVVAVDHVHAAGIEPYITRGAVNDGSAVHMVARDELDAFILARKWLADGGGTRIYTNEQHMKYVHDD